MPGKFLIQESISLLLNKRNAGMLTFKSELIDLESNVWRLGIIVPVKIAEHFLKLNDKRVICTLNNQISLHVALTPKGSNTWFFNVNKETKIALNISEGTLVEISIETDETKYGMQAPEEFLELLIQDPEGKKVFESLTMGKQRTLLQQVLMVKNSDKRVEKSIIILEYLKDVNGQINFRSLNEAYKNSRF